MLRTRDRLPVCLLVSESIAVAGHFKLLDKEY